MKGSFVLASGGTGGHLFPAEALSAELIGSGNNVHLITDSRTETFPLEVPHIEVHQVRTGQFGGGPAHAARRATRTLPRATWSHAWRP